MKNRLFIVLGILLLLVVSACGSTNNEESDSSEKNNDKESEQADSNLIIRIQDDPKTFNPIFAGDGMSLMIGQAVFSPLVTFPEEGAAVQLAESLEESDDLKTYTLTLREDIKWHDGEEFSADDVIFTVNSILDESQNSYLRGLFVLDGEPISMNKVDDRTIEFELPEATAAFTSALSQVYPIAEHIYADETDLEKSEKNQNPIGTGPFKFEEFRTGEYVMVERFDDYFGDEAKLDKITYRVSKDINASVLALQNGEINLMAIDADNYSKFADNDQFDLELFPSGGVTTMVYNLNIDVMQDEKVRQAIAHGIDKEELVTAGYTSIDLAQPANSIFSPGTLYQTEELTTYDYDPELAKSLLKEAGHESLEITFAYFNASKAEENMALHLKQKLQEIGVELDLVPLDGAALGEKALNPDNVDYDMSFGGSNMGTEPDSYKALYLSDAAYNYAHYKNEDYDNLWNKAAVETDEVERAKLYAEIQEHAAETITTYPIAYGKVIIALDERFGGMEEAKPEATELFEDYTKLFVK